MLLVLGWFSLVLFEPSIYKTKIRWHHVLFCCPVFWTFLTRKKNNLLLIQGWGRWWYNFFFQKSFALVYVKKWAYFGASFQPLAHEMFPATYISTKVKFNFHFQPYSCIYLDKAQFLFGFKPLISCICKKFKQRANVIILMLITFCVTLEIFVYN